MTRRFIFLDIDGVLAHFGSNEQLDPACIALLDELIVATGAEVIVTSSWRDRYGLPGVQERLARAGFRAQLAGAVPCMPHASRSDEIDAFLAEQVEPLHFVILDDVPVAAHLKTHLVLTDDFVGLNEPDIARATAILSRTASARAV